MSPLTYNSRWIALLCIAVLLGGMTIGGGSAAQHDDAAALSLTAARNVPASSALVNRGASAELQQLRIDADSFFSIELPANQPGNDWSLFSSDAPTWGAPTLHAQAVRLQI